MVLLLLPAILMLSLLFFEREGLRGALVFGSIIFGALLLTITELLSWLTLLNSWTLILFWVVFDAVLAWHCFRNNLHKHIPSALQALRSLRPQFSGWFVLFALSVTLFVALKAPPNNYDSMTYHMTRVAYWIQNQSVEHFPTHNTRQIFMGPWVEYVILHLQLLGFGSDRFANLAQWAAFPGLMIVASLLVTRFGGGRKAQWFAALLVATTPMAILQASSTQTDLACSYWVLVFAWLVLKLLDPDAPAEMGLWALAGLALGLAVATKGTAYVFCAPFLVGLGAYSLVRRGFRSGCRGLLLIAILSLSLNLPHYLRNYQTFSHPLGDPLHMQLLQNEKRSPGILVSNLLRNFSLHLQTPFADLNEEVAAVVIAFHGPLGVDASDPATTWGRKYHLSQVILHEDFAGNLLLFGLIVIGSLCLFKARLPGTALFCLAGAMAGIVLFSYMLKWQIWGARLQLPFFMLLAPIVSLVLAELVEVPQKLFICMVFVCAASSLLWLFYNTSRPILKNQYNRAKNILTTPRTVQYFNNNRGPEISYYYALEKLKAIRCYNVGLMTNLDSYEYPLIALQSEVAPEQGISFHHLFVKNHSNATRSENPQVCAILAIDQADDWRPEPPYAAWRSVFRREHAQIFVPPAR